MNQKSSGASGTARRTTVLLQAEDLENIEAIKELRSSTDTQLIRQGLRLLRELLTFQEETGGRIVLEHGRDRQVIRFL